ncbi:MAG TPA: TolC family protein, partial [Myxococcota bacterium]|nr:TolC family protein [Myxococcota bacterium]
GLVVAREAQKLTAEAVANATKHAEMVEKQLAAGLAPPNASLQAQLAVARAERERANADASVQRAEQAFALLTGLDPSTPVSLPEPLPLPVDSLDAALEAALSSRHDVEAAGYRLNAAEANRGLSYAGWLPSLTGVFRLNVNPKTDFNPDPTRWKLILNAQWNLWDGGMRIGANQVASSQYRQASDAEEKVRLEAEQQVTLAWEEYSRASVAVAAVEREVRLAEDNLRLAEVAYQAGTLTFLDLEDARLGWKAARMSQLGERMNRDLAVIDLMVAIGRY